MLSKSSIIEVSTSISSALPCVCFIFSAAKYCANSKNSIHVASLCLSSSGIPKTSDSVNIGICCDKSLTRLDLPTLAIASSKVSTLISTFL